MRLGLKIFLLLFVAAFTISGATGSYFYYQARQSLLESIQSQLLTAAKSFSGLISGEDLETLKSPEDMDSSAYSRVQEVLYQITQTNDDFLFAYTMRIQDNKVMFVVDSPPSDDTGDGLISQDEMPEPVGAVYPDPPSSMLKGFVRPSVDDQIYQDQWGWTISGYAPVKDVRGRNVGLLGIDMCAEHMEARLATIRRAGMLSLGVAGFLALGVTLVLARHITGPIKSLHRGLSRVSAGNLDARVPEQGRDEIGELSRHFNRMVGELREKQLLQSSLGKIMPREAVNRLLADDPKLGGETAVACILFCDLRGFSSISEKLPPKILVGLLNDYFSAMVQAVEKHGGLVDKFVGDKIMAVFGHPLADEQAEANALQAGVEMLSACDRLNSTLALTSELTLENSIGIHTGYVLAGNIGSPQRMEYTVIGDAVNIAARLEAKTRELHTRLIISAHAAAKISPLPGQLRMIKDTSLEGRQETLDVYLLENKHPAGDTGV
ncbi:adenylate/guanylate cyclase domain-containing protein [Desulfonatronospira sp.]|uniref:adenylate/guanylate cyclase domain-containing protein n=1 Tax=Desulfonatronospira sp. TaxID=1962951 RepID=UPI0025C655B9|nr:adenylate/guanylate cyclase domain-containing protein [Desulfonatronospira sp.]